MKLAGWILTTALIVPLAAPAASRAQGDKDKEQATKHLSLQGEHFLTVLADEDQSEIELAKLALQKSGNGQVRQYAQTKILAADPGMEQEAKKIAAQSAPPGGLPTPSDKAEYYFLSKMSGKDFDMGYMNYEDAKQHEDIIMVQHEAEGGKDPQVKAFAQKEQKSVAAAANAAGSIASALAKQ